MENENKNKNNALKIITVNVPEAEIAAIETLSKINGLSRSEIVRIALRDFFLQELKNADKYNNEKSVKTPKNEAINETVSVNYGNEIKTFKIIKRLVY